jgi:hypothetical protein
VTPDLKLQLGWQTCKYGELDEFAALSIELARRIVDGLNTQMKCS